MASMSRNRNGGHTQVLEVMLENGADAKVKSHKGWTSLCLAKKKGQTEIAELLREHGAKE